MLGRHSPPSGGLLELVFLNGCKGLELGRDVQDAGVPTVVCWETKAHDGAALIFSKAFFDSVARGRTYAKSFDDAKDAVLMPTRPGKLANGLAADVPMYELRAPNTPAAAQTNPPPMAAGVPVLLEPPPGPSSPSVAAAP